MNFDFGINNNNNYKKKNNSNRSSHHFHHSHHHRPPPRPPLLEFAGITFTPYVEEFEVCTKNTFLHYTVASADLRQTRLVGAQSPSTPTTTRIPPQQPPSNDWPDNNRIRTRSSAAILQHLDDVEDRAEEGQNNSNVMFYRHFPSELCCEDRKYHHHHYTITGGGSVEGNNNHHAAQHSPQSVGDLSTMTGATTEEEGDNINKLPFDECDEDTETRTTVMLRHIPNKYTQRMLLDVVDQEFKTLYDWFYLPIDFKNQCNVGYAFINFISPAYALRFMRAFHRKKLDLFKSKKVCDVSWGRVQGLNANIDHYRNSAIVTIASPGYRPLLFRDGVACPFPSENNSSTTTTTATVNYRGNQSSSSASSLSSSSSHQKPANRNFYGPSAIPRTKSSSSSSSSNSELSQL